MFGLSSDVHSPVNYLTVSPVFLTLYMLVGLAVAYSVIAASICAFVMVPDDTQTLNKGCTAASNPALLTL